MNLLDFDFILVKISGNLNLNFILCCFFCCLDYLNMKEFLVITLDLISDLYDNSIKIYLICFIIGKVYNSYLDLVFVF